MVSDTFYFNTSDDYEIFIRTFRPDNTKKAKAIVQIIHGMQEHGGRYGEMAEFLVEEKYIVVVSDHRGHGKTVKAERERGFFAPVKGWQRVVQDLLELNAYIRNKYPQKDCFLFGHSMGSFLAWHLATLIGTQLVGLVLSATTAYNRIYLFFAHKLAWIVKSLAGKNKPNRFLQKASTGKFNSAFKPNRTNADWLSQDEVAVDAFRNDPLCGGVFTGQFYFDLSCGVMYVNSPHNIKKIPRDLPVHFVSGTCDPLGRFTKGTNMAIKRFKKAGIKNITYKFYENGRHELFKEAFRHRFFGDIAAWLDRRV